MEKTSLSSSLNSSSPQSSLDDETNFPKTTEAVADIDQEGTVASGGLGAETKGTANKVRAAPAVWRRSLGDNQVVVLVCRGREEGAFGSNKLLFLVICFTPGLLGALGLFIIIFFSRKIPGFLICSMEGLNEAQVILVASLCSHLIYAGNIPGPHFSTFLKAGASTSSLYVTQGATELVTAGLPATIDLIKKHNLTGIELVFVPTDSTIVITKASSIGADLVTHKGPMALIVRSCSSTPVVITTALANVLMTHVNTTGPLSAVTFLNNFNRTDPGQTQGNVTTMVAQMEAMRTHLGTLKVTKDNMCYSLTLLGFDETNSAPVPYSRICELVKEPGAQQVVENPESLSETLSYTDGAGVTKRYTFDGSQSLQRKADTIGAMTPFRKWCAAAYDVQSDDLDNVCGEPAPLLHKLREISRLHAHFLPRTMADVAPPRGGDQLGPWDRLPHWMARR